LEPAGKEPEAEGTPTVVGQVGAPVTVSVTVTVAVEQIGAAEVGLVPEQAPLLM
jgi:hypothetical protein